MNPFNVSMLGILIFSWGVAVWVRLWHVGWIQTLRESGRAGVCAPSGAA